MSRKIVVVGTVRFSRACFEGLVQAGAGIAGVITGDAVTLAKHADACSLRGAAEAAGVPCLETHDINQDAVRHWLADLCPDVLLVVGWSQLLRPPLVAIPSLAAIGSHPTLLPEGRGRHPIIWTLLNGKQRSGLTFFVLHDRADAGDIVLQEAFDISDEDDAGSVYARIETLGWSMMPALLQQIEAGLPNRWPQDPSRATEYRKRSVRDGEIEWSRPATEIRNLIRALTAPYPGAHTHLHRPTETSVVTVWRATVAAVPDAAASPGDVRVVDGRTYARAGDGWLRLDRYTPDGTLRSGDRLGHES